MIKRLAIPLVLAILLVAGSVSLFVFWDRKRIQSAPRRQPPQHYDYLPIGDEGVVGEWNRVEFPEAVIAINWRKFSKSGKSIVRYGDIIIRETYKLLDDKTIEIRQDHNGEVMRWQFAFRDGQLVMTNHTNRWVEKYRRVKPGTLDPEIRIRGVNPFSLIISIPRSRQLWKIKSLNLR